MNNNLFDCPTALYYDDGTTNLTTIAAVNALGDTLANGNVSVDPSFVNQIGGDWHFATDGTAPCLVTQGGLDLSASGIINDNDGTLRTVLYSMGAYEHDGAWAP